MRETLGSEADRVVGRDRKGWSERILVQHEGTYAECLGNDGAPTQVSEDKGWDGREI